MASPDLPENHRHEQLGSVRTTALSERLTRIERRCTLAHAAREDGGACVCRGACSVVVEVTYRTDPVPSGA